MPNKKTVRIDRSVTETNDAMAQRISHSLSDVNVLSVNIMGSPGSGKTSVIEGITNTIPAAEIAVIQGDLESDIDKRRMESVGIAAYQINTHSGCHLTAAMIEQAIVNLTFEHTRFLLIENVGNLVCPADVLIGQHLNIVVSSTTEGSDKPRKYPVIFKRADLIVITKEDLASAVGFDEKSYIMDIHSMNPRAKIIKTTTKDKDSFRSVADWLMHEYSLFYPGENP
jgi:hydrogenase nickel incorporation protein HypB